MSWKISELNERQKRMVNEALSKDNNATHNPVPERSKELALGRASQVKEGLVHLDLPVLVRITRYYSGRLRRFDDDNFVGGCKELRDAVTALLGLPGDSKEDGIAFEYAQEKAAVSRTEIYIQEVDRI